MKADKIETFINNRSNPNVFWQGSKFNNGRTIDRIRKIVYPSTLQELAFSPYILIPPVIPGILPKKATAFEISLLYSTALYDVSFIIKGFITIVNYCYIINILNV